MAEKIVSPGVFTKEIDASFLPAAIGDIGACVVGPTVKGPALVPTVVTSYSEYQALFGDTFKSGSKYYQYLTSHTAKNYLQYAGRLTVVRVMGSGYSGANATISSSIDPNIVGGGTAATGSLTITYQASGAYGTNHSCSIGTATFIFTGSFAGGDHSTYNADTATTIYVLTGSNVAGTATNLKEAINISQSLHGVQVTASVDSNKVELTSSLAGNYQLGSSVFLHGGSTVSGTIGILTSSNELYAGGNFGVEILQGGLDYNNSTFLQPVVLHTLSDGAILNNEGTILTNHMLGTGSKNNVRWEIPTINKEKGTFTLLVRRGDDTIKRKQILETWNNVSLDPNASNYVSKIVGDQYVTVAGTTSDPFLQFNGDYPNKSKYVRVEVKSKTIDYLDENGNVRDNALSASLPGSGSGSLAGAFSNGSDGRVDNITASMNHQIGSVSQGFDLSVPAQSDQYVTALNLLSNADEYDFNLLLLPGVIRNQTGHTAIITKAIDVCESRGDAFFVADTVDYDTNAFGTVTDQAKAMDSNYAATYWPWIQTPDPQTGENVWVPPSVVIAGIYAYNDKVGAPWFAPAGLGRGVITTAVQAKRRLTHGNRDTLYEGHVNPIATFPGQGVVVWGQKTLQKKSSALDRVNVRRLLIKVKKFIAASSRFLVFEQNNATTRERFLNIANPYLEQVQAQSGLNAFKVVMDETNNTPDIVDRNILYGQIFVQPTKTAEFIVLDFTIQPTGATFPE